MTPATLAIAAAATKLVRVVLNMTLASPCRCFCLRSRRLRRRSVRDAPLALMRSVKAFLT
jgi:hypothetical protein